MTLLNARAEVVVEVGKVKRRDDVPIYAPHREAEVLSRVLEANEGPLPDRAVEGVYRELMSGSFAIEQPLRIGYLGPEGSFSHAAAAAHFGSSVSYEDARAIPGVLTEVAKGRLDYGLVPIENSIGGGVTETLDALGRAPEGVFVYGEVCLAVRHCVLAHDPPGELHTFHSRPEVFAQCRQWLATQYPDAALVASVSSSAAVSQVASARQPGHAAIGSALAGRLYGVNALFEGVEDDAGNVTRFYVIARQQAAPSGDDKTALMFAVPDEAGALVDVLGVFRDAGVNLSHIDKRPSGRQNWTYTFFADAVGHRDDAAMSRVLSMLPGVCSELRVLGSYPRARRIL